MKKEWALFKCTGKNSIWYIRNAFLLISFFYLISFIGDSSSFNLKGVITYLVNLLVLITVTVVLGMHYSDFKIAVQFGFSRKTLWKEKYIELIIMSLITWCLFLLENGFSETIYNWIMLLVIFDIYVSFFAFTSFFSLFSRRIKILVGAALMFLTWVCSLRWVIFASTHVKILQSYANFISHNVYSSLTILGIIGAIIMIVISYVSIIKKQLRKD